MPPGSGRPETQVQPRFTARGAYGKPLHLPLKFEKTAQNGQKNQHPIFTTINPPCLPPECSPLRRPSVYTGAQRPLLCGERTRPPLPPGWSRWHPPALRGALRVSSLAVIPQTQPLPAHSAGPHHTGTACPAWQPTQAVSPALPALPGPQPSRCPDTHVGGPARSVPVTRYTQGHQHLTPAPARSTWSDHRCRLCQVP